MGHIARFGISLAGVLLLAFVSSACSHSGLQSAFPTGPSGALLREVSRGPSGTFATDHGLPPDDVDQVINPCTGEMVDVTTHWVKAVFREEVDATGGTHFMFTDVVDVYTSDGFSGRGALSGSATNSPGGSDLDEVSTFAGALTLANSSGQRIVAQFHGHLVMKDGNVIRAFEVQLLRCVGKPVA